MGIETSADHGGAESSFTSAIIAIEELAKIDPSVSVMCDVHNTLVNTIFRKYATKEQQDKWLPQLAENKVRFDPLATNQMSHPFIHVSSSVLSVYQSPLQDPMRLLCRPAQGKMGITGSLTVPKCGSQIPTRPKYSLFSLMYNLLAPINSFFLTHLVAL